MIDEVRQQRFEQIGVDAIVRAEREAAAHDAFIDGLERIRKLVENRLKAAREEYEISSPGSPAPFLDYDPDEGFSASGWIKAKCGRCGGIGCVKAVDNYRTAGHASWMTCPSCRGSGAT